MAALRLEWTLSARQAFEGLKTLASQTGHLDRFLLNHQAIVDTLSDLGDALVQGELLYTTRLPGGEVRHWICDFISVCYAVRRDDQIC